MAQLWAGILDVPLDTIAATDTFTGLGGDSVQAMRLVNAAYRKHLTLTVNLVFSKPQLRQLAKAVTAKVSETIPHPTPFELLDGRDVADQICKQVPIDAGNVQDILPISHAQREYLDGSQSQGPTGVHWFYIDLPSITEVDLCLTAALVWSITSKCYVQSL